MKTVIVYGPQACGKTRNAEALRNHFGCANIVDDWSLTQYVVHGSLHLTNEEFSDLSSPQGFGSNPSVTLMAFDTAIAEMEAVLRAKPSSVASTSKPTNPKDAVGIRKWRQFATIPFTVVCEIGVAMMEGALKYGRHNYRVAGVRASVYKDAAIGHIMCWWEGEDLDPDTKLSHITKAIASLVVLRDAMIQRKLNDDRPPKGNLDEVRANLQRVVDEMFDKYPEPKDAFTEIGEQRLKHMTSVKIDPGVINVTVANHAAVDAPIFGPGGIVRRPQLSGERTIDQAVADKAAGAQAISGMRFHRGGVVARSQFISPGERTIDEAIAEISKS